MRRERRQRRYAERQARRWLEINDRAHASKTACRKPVADHFRSRCCSVRLRNADIAASRERRRKAWEVDWILTQKRWRRQWHTRQKRPWRFRQK